ncbi:MAG: TetR/AcrR family transcriptional regulator [Chloroflexi bacterium]|nr:TetR/AcrR family transcriptional regulator [Chloroflexota bacterium]
MVKRQERKEQITEYRQRQILDAALTVFSKKGYGEATIPDIAREAGVAVGTIYNYYESKRDLLVAIVNTFVVTQPFRELLKQAGQGDEKKFVRSIIKDRLGWGFENADRFLFVFTEILRDPELREPFSEKVLSPVLQFPEKYLAAKIASGDFRRLNHRLMVRAMVGMVIGFILLRKLEGERSPVQGLPTSKMAAELSNFVINGLQKKGS